MNIAGRKALITGGASGIGLEAARRLAQEGATVALLDVDAAKLDSAVKEIGKSAFAIRGDVSTRAAVHEAVGKAITQLGGLDTLIVSAGVVDVNSVEDVTEEAWDRVLAINLKGAFFTCQAAASALRASGRGRIVTISSDAGRRGVPGMHAYTASKFGLNGITESLAAELAPQVTVNAICPVGVADTGMGQKMLAWKVKHTGRTPEQVLASIKNGLPLKRAAAPSDIADAVLFFVSDFAKLITGVALDIDSGAHLNLLPGAQ